MKEEEDDANEDKARKKRREERKLCKWCMMRECAHRKKERREDAKPRTERKSESTGVGLDSCESSKS